MVTGKAAGSLVFSGRPLQFMGGALLCLAAALPLWLLPRSAPAPSGPGSGPVRPAMVHLPAVAGQPGFFLSRTQVTDDQYQRVMGTRPAGGVTYDEAVTYCKRLSDLEGRKPGYRLPTQKEWDDAVKLDREPVAGAPLFHIGDPPAEWIADQKDPARRRGLRVARSE